MRVCPSVLSVPTLSFDVLWFLRFVSVHWYMAYDFASVAFVWATKHKSDGAFHSQRFEMNVENSVVIVT